MKPARNPHHYDLSQDKLIDAWQALEQFAKVLHPFKKSTNHMEGDPNKAGLEGSHDVIWETVKAMDIMFGKLKKVGDEINADPDSYSDHEITGVDEAYCKLIKYFDRTEKPYLPRGYSSSC